MAKKDGGADKKARKVANVSTTAAQKQQQFIFKMGGVGLVVAIVIGVLSFFSGGGSDVPLLESEAELKEALLSGNPWLLQCVNDSTPVFSVTSNAATLLKDSAVKVGSINCHKQMPSGKTFFQRFKLFKAAKLMMKPLLFTISNGNDPVLVTAQKSKTAEKLASYAKARTQMRVMPLFSTEDMDNYCLKKKGRVCIVAAGNNVNNAMPKRYPWIKTTLKVNRLVKFVSLNTKKYKVKARPLTMRPKENSTDPGIFVLQRAVKAKAEAEDGEKDKNATDIVMGKEMDDDFNEANFNAFLTKAVAGELEMEELDEKPVIRESARERAKQGRPQREKKEDSLTAEQRKAIQAEKEKRARERMEREEADYARKVMGDEVTEEDKEGEGE